MFNLVCKLYFPLIFLVLSGCGSGVVKSNQGTSAFKTEDYQTARELYIDALLEDPESVYYRYNLAVANAAGERLSDAQKELDAIEDLYRRRDISEADKKAKMASQVKTKKMAAKKGKSPTIRVTIRTQKEMTKTRKT